MKVRLGKGVTADELKEGKFDHVVIATGVVPRTPSIPGVKHPMCLSYIDVIKHKKPVGRRVAIIGAGIHSRLFVAEFILVRWYWL